MDKEIKKAETEACLHAGPNISFYHSFLLFWVSSFEAVADTSDLIIDRWVKLEFAIET